ncbi:MAG: hypothetical protein QF787_17800, partial [Nitrospinota bacterium]|nr:hypothetical protein [Nitrospinota bacterium]
IDPSSIIIIVNLDIVEIVFNRDKNESGGLNAGMMIAIFIILFINILEEFYYLNITVKKTLFHLGNRVLPYYVGTRGFEPPAP